VLDFLIKGATVVDGTGAPGRIADVGIRDGRIAAVGAIDEDAAETIDADGLVLAPGFVDPHTHYDAQLFWDPFATPSNLHGITTIIAGNCGFTLAPLVGGEPEADYLRNMMAKVEGMPLAALENGVDWNWSAFGEFLDRLDGNVGVNAAFLVGHCALRRAVMGADAVGNEATPDQIEAMKAELATAIEAGGLGFSSTQAFTHSDGDGQPVPSRWASRDEVLELCAVVRDHEGTTLEVIVDGCLNGFSDDEIEGLTEMSLAGRRPINWNVLTVDSREPDKYQRQLEASKYAKEHGAEVVALTMPILVPMNMSLLTFCALNLMPGWGDVLGLPLEERIEKLGDPDVQKKLDADAHSDEAGILRRLADWEEYHIGDTYAPENKVHEGRRVGDIADERGEDAFATLIDICIADDLRTVLWPTPPENDDESWRMRAELWQSGGAMLGGSDAGAHLDRMLGSTYPSAFLGDMIRGRRLVSMEEAVRLMTDVPARLFGLRERGRITEGWHADLVLFDPATVDSEPVRKVSDLPGGTDRLFAGATGIRKVFVNGRPIVSDGEATGDLPGTVLRSGRDTETVEVPGPA
jgi:N-acyl-D-aspartate/D-glutamate deacylase